MDAEFEYTFENDYHNVVEQKAKVEWVCSTKCEPIANQFNATSFSFVATDKSATITIGLPIEISNLDEPQRNAILKGTFKGTLELWIPQINIKETITYI